MTEAGILARHLEWEATNRRAANKAFNVVNGDYFRWRKMWRFIAGCFGIEAADYPGHVSPLARDLADAEPDWAMIVRRHRLGKTRLAEIAPWWHVDADLGRTQECITDMSRSRELGFLKFRRTSAALEALFARLRKERIIP
jgi:hypothetical protein